MVVVVVAVVVVVVVSVIHMVVVFQLFFSPDGHLGVDDPLEAPCGPVSASFVDVHVDSWIAAFRRPIGRARNAGITPEAVLTLTCVRRTERTQEKLTHEH